MTKYFERLLRLPRRLFFARVLVCGFGYQFFVMRHFLCNVLVYYTTCLGRGCAHYEKIGTLRKKVTHHKQLVPVTSKLVPEIRTSAISVLIVQTSCFSMKKFSMFERRTDLLNSFERVLESVKCIQCKSIRTIKGNLTLL